MKTSLARLRLVLGACLALAVGTGAWAQSRHAMPPGYYGLPTPPRGDALFRQVMLSAHNDERQAFALQPLTWDEGLAADAARYAAEMARTGVFAHASRAGQTRMEGENLWMGTRGFFGYDAMVGTFVAEKRYFRTGGGLPNVSTTGSWEDVGHYTQMIWRGTRSVGCALAQGPDDDYLVCRYWPAGNVWGRGPLDSDGMATRIAGR